MTTQVKAVRLAASGYIVKQRSRLRALHYSGAAAAGSIAVKSTTDDTGGTGGTTFLTIDTPASAAFGEYIKLPGLGIECEANMYATLTNVTAATFFWG